MNFDKASAFRTAAEIAALCGCDADKIEALARSNHWPRVHGAEGSKIAVDLDAVRRALGSTPAMTHGSAPANR